MVAPTTATGTTATAPAPATHAGVRVTCSILAGSNPCGHDARRGYGVNVMPDPATLQGIVNDFAREPGRSAYVVLRIGDWSWSGGINADEPQPAASLLKLAIGMAIEDRLDSLESARVSDVLRPTDVSVLHSFSADRELTAHEVHALMLSASDAPSARWATSRAGIPAITAAALESGADRIEIVPDDDFGVLGTITARNALDLVMAATDEARFPACSHALSHSVVNSRIPLGVSAPDIVVAHKSGTLAGVANDVAHLTCREGDAWLAFLSKDQHDTLVTGYEMGLCTRALLECAGLQAVRSLSFADPL